MPIRPTATSSSRRIGPAWQADDDRTLAREYEQVLQSGARPPMLYASLSLAVGAQDRDELERRVERTRQAFGEVELYRPRGLQEALWLDHLPRVDGGRVPDYVQQVTAEQFGAMVPTATTLVGDDGGVLLGHMTGGLRAPVLYDVTAPPRESRPGAVVLAGTTGAGKTVAAQLIALGVVPRGSRVLDFDPKADHGWENIAPLGDRLEVLTLGGGGRRAGCARSARYRSRRAARRSHALLPVGVAARSAGLVGARHCARGPGRRVGAASVHASGARPPASARRHRGQRGRPTRSTSWQRSVSAVSGSDATMTMLLPRRSPA